MAEDNQDFTKSNFGCAWPGFQTQVVMENAVRAPLLFMPALLWGSCEVQQTAISNAFWELCL